MTYKLKYFNGKGVAEPIRIILAYMGENYEDVRFEREEWPKIKPTTPFGKVPVLEVNGKVVCQSLAISRYLAKKAGIAGKTEWEALQIDMFVDTIADLRACLSQAFQEQDPDVKAKKMEGLTSETVPFYMKKFEDILKNNQGHVCNGTFSWGDIYLAAVVDQFADFKLFNPDDFPKCKALKEKVFGMPKIKEWIEKRPATPF